ncbi:MAG: metal-dependent hydrolase [Gammaproteobacteria bacterium]|nr:MAG: metal-dependent hydrolase [Gammaproteobacteria bacterium]
MANGSTHRVVAALVVGGTAAYAQAETTGDQVNLRPLGAAALAAALTNLPDVLEPSLNNPRHRAFFHSVVFAGLVAYGMHKTHEWKPETPIEELVRFALLVGGGAVLVHLALDALTPRSLPLVGV